VCVKLMASGELYSDPLHKGLHWFEEDLRKLENDDAPESHQHACRFVISIIQEKLDEVGNDNNKQHTIVDTLQYYGIETMN
jgi:hypothetical protein